MAGNVGVLGSADTDGTSSGVPACGLRVYPFAIILCAFAVEDEAHREAFLVALPDILAGNTGAGRVSKGNCTCDFDWSLRIPAFDGLANVAVAAPSGRRRA